MEQANREIGKMEELTFRLKNGICALYAIYTAMEYGPDDAKSYLKGLFAMIEYVNDQFTGIEMSVNTLLEYKKHAK